jgi:hypothetical protein
MKDRHGFECLREDMLTAVLAYCLETETEQRPEPRPHPRLQHRRRARFNVPSLRPMRIIFNFIRTCKAHWEWAHNPKCTLWDHIAAKYHIPTSKQFTRKNPLVSTYEIIRMNLAEECRICNAPRAQSRLNMGMRCCGYCFENLTVSQQALKLITNSSGITNINGITPADLERASSKPVRTDWRYVSSGSSGRKKRRELVYFLPDLLRNQCSV